MKMLQRLLSTVALLSLAACGGGGGNSGTAPFGGGGGTGGGPVVTTPSASDIVLAVSATSLANNGTETVIATATAIDANRNTVAGVPVTVSVNNNGVVTPSGVATNASGQLNATVGIGSDRTNRVLTITAVSGSISKTTTVQVQDTGGAAGGAASDLLLTLGASTIANNGNTLVKVTATALDARRNVMPGVVVSISANQGATVAPSGTTTDDSGVVTAQIGTGGNSTLRTIEVTATAPGLAPRVVSLNVVAAPTTSNPIASDLSLALSANTLVNGGTSTLLATVTAVDANRIALAGIPVAISVDNNAVATVSAITTNASGVVTATIGIGADRSNRSVTVTASSGGLTRSATFVIVGAALSASFSPTVAASSAGNQVEYRLVDFTNSAMAAQSITVTAPGLSPITGLTDANGKYVYTYTAPDNPTTLNLVATAAGDTKTQVIAVQAVGSTVPNATSVPESASLTPTPSVVSVNTAGSTSNQVELRALFLGANNQPVQNVRVIFRVDPDETLGKATQVGGAVYAYSDATGVARGTFTPGQRSSPTNGVRLLACWGTDDFDINAACPANRQIANTLTIASEALSVNIRTNNLIKTGAAGLTYIKEYVVMVVDAAGQAKPDVLITPSIDLTGYFKGFYFWNGSVWQQQITLANTESYGWNSTMWKSALCNSNGDCNEWTAAGWNPPLASLAVPAPVLVTTPEPLCPNEDVNRNGVREAAAFSAGGLAPKLTGRQEDLNWNGDIDPRKSDVAIKMVGSPRTDSSGLAVLQIEYGQSVASWVDYIITVTASGISGTESRARFAGLHYGVGNLPYPATAVADEKVAPAFVFSPYGRGAVCTDGD